MTPVASGSIGVPRAGHRPLGSRTSARTPSPGPGPATEMHEFEGGHLAPKPVESDEGDHGGRDQRPRGAVGDYEAQLGCGVGRVHRNDNEPGVQRAQVHLDELGAGAQLQHEPVTGAEPELTQAGGAGPDGAVQLGPGDPAATVDQDHPVAAASPPALSPAAPRGQRGPARRLGAPASSTKSATRVAAARVRPWWTSSPTEPSVPRIRLDCVQNRALWTTATPAVRTGDRIVAKPPPLPRGPRVVAVTCARGTGARRSPYPSSSDRRPGGPHVCACRRVSVERDVDPGQATAEFAVAGCPTASRGPRPRGPPARCPPHRGPHTAAAHGHARAHQHAVPSSTLLPARVPTSLERAHQHAHARRRGPRRPTTRPLTAGRPTVRRGPPWPRLSAVDNAPSRTRTPTRAKSRTMRSTTHRARHRGRVGPRPPHPGRRRGSVRPALRPLRRHRLPLRLLPPR